MEYKEVKKRDGQRLIFCNFEDLLKEYYGVSSMEEVEPFQNSTNEYIIHCPFCKEEGHTKHKLYIKSDLTVGHCFVCTRTYIHVTDQVDTSYKIPDFFPLFHRKHGVELVKLNDPVWSLEKYKFEFDNYDETGVSYLTGRHRFMTELYKILDFKFMDGNIVMPFKYKGEVFYYQIRFSGKNNKIRYFFPPISAKPPYIIEHGNCKKVIICEGIFDAIALLIMAPEFMPVAILGSSISDYQLDFIREYVPDEIIVYMDETEISKRVARKIQATIDYCPIRLIKSDGQDPEENLKERLKFNKKLNWIHAKYNS